LAAYRFGVGYNLQQFRFQILRTFADMANQEPTDKSTTNGSPSLSLEQPADAWQRKVQLGWVAGGMSALVSAMALYRFQPDTTASLLWSGLDIVIVLLLSVGVYKRLLWAGIALFGYFLADTALLFLAGTLENSLFSLLYGYFYYQAMMALMALRNVATPPAQP